MVLDTARPQIPEFAPLSLTRRAQRSPGARLRIQGFPGHSKESRTSMCEQAHFLKLKPPPLQPFVSSPVELKYRQGHSQERIHKLAVHNFNRYRSRQVG